MAKAEISPGACGFETIVEVTKEDNNLNISIQSKCKAIQKLAEELKTVEPYSEISFKGDLPRTIELGIKHCIHSACPVPVGIIKAIEIAAGLNIPKDTTIKLSK